jgi:hypothetical protein
MGFTPSQWARVLGYASPDQARLRTQIMDMEAGRKPITGTVARLAEMFARFGIPDDF